MSEKDKLIVELADMLEEGSELVYDSYLEEDRVSDFYLGKVPHQVTWAEKAKEYVKRARKIVKS